MENIKDFVIEGEWRLLLCPALESFKWKEEL